MYVYTLAKNNGEPAERLGSSYMLAHTDTHTHTHTHTGRRDKKRHTFEIFRSFRKMLQESEL